MAASLNMFYGKMWDRFVLTQENAFSWRFCFKANRKILWYPLKTVLGIFKTPPFKRSACFYVTDNHYVFWTFNTLTFNTSTLKQVFQETIIVLQKLEYLLLVQSTNEWKRNISIQNFLQKLMLIQIEWGVENGRITKIVLLPLITLKIQFEHQNLL